MPNADLAYALLTVKSLNDDRREFSGLATTPDLDRAGHIVEPAGVTFSNPVPLLFHHDRTAPIGTVTLGKPTADGVSFTATLPKVATPGRLRDRVDEAWDCIKHELIRGVSIGFRVINDGIKFLKNGDLVFTNIEVVELSLVTIPANERASISVVKHYAASGVHSPGDTGHSRPTGRTHMDTTKTTAEQIAAFEASRSAKAARMVDIMGKAAGENTTLDDAQSAEYEELDGQVKSIDVHLVRLRNLEKLAVASATPVARAAGQNGDSGSAVRGGGGVVQVRSSLPAGTAFVRAACSLLVCKGNFDQAASYARSRWNDTTPEVETYLKAAVAAGNTTDATWASPLVNQSIANEFLDLLRPATILGKIPGLRTVPFNTKVPSQTAGGTYGWVGEAKPKPVTKLAFGSETLAVAKAAGIIVLTEELVRLSNPSAEALVRNDMIQGIARFLDQQFIDPAVAAVAGVNPASVTNGAPNVIATANPLSDLLILIRYFATNNVPLNGITIILSEANALAMSFHTNPDGSPVFPGIGISGGNYRGINFVTSQAANGWVIALQPSLILYADDGGVTIDASREASVQMDSAPMSPADATTVLVSLWQNNLVGLRAERFVNWKRASNFAVTYLTAANYPAPAGAAVTEPAA